MKKFLKTVTGLSASAVLLLGITIAYIHLSTPDSYQVTAGKSLELGQMAVTVRNENTHQSITAASLREPNKYYRAQLMFLNAIPIKTVDINVIDENWFIPCGTPFGIKMFTNGVIVVGTADIKTKSSTVNPAVVAGLKVGDVITAVNGKRINQNEELAAAIENSDGKVLKLSITRSNNTININLAPVKSELDQVYKGGMWVRDSTAGIGTITFFNPSNGAFAGLGHGICDVDTNEIMPLRSGDIVSVTISGIIKGEKGTAGELRGYFNSDIPFGTLNANVEQGVYGTLKYSPINNKAVKVAMKQEVKTGAAKILTTIDGGKPNFYDIQIDSVNYNNNVQTKNMVIRVTDPALLNATGGIVQGMSGSPILQNGMLVGAVTHVFVNDPTRGYGIFAENMMDTSKNVMKQTTKKAS